MMSKPGILALLCCVPLLLGCGKHGGEGGETYVGPPVIQLQVFDSKYYAIDERILSISFSGEGQEIVWAEDDAVLQPRIQHGKGNAEVKEFQVNPGHFSGAFTVVTSRSTYTFSRVFDAAQNKKVEVTLDFAAPDKQPKRKVGVLGDSISTFKGAMCNDTYSCFYPDDDPNVASGDKEAVDSKTKTYWWIVVNDLMKNGTMDANSSWAGKRVIHETSHDLPAGLVDRVGDFIDPDIILIHGGTNDKNKDTPLGSYDYDLPIEELDETCFRSAYIKMIRLLQERYEGVQLILIIGDMLSSDYANSITTIAAHYKLPYVSFAGAQLPKCKGSHPNYSGMKIMAKDIYAKCKDYLP